MIHKSKSILCWSGGLDSFIAWFFLRKPKTIFFHTGHLYCRQERIVAAKFSKKYGMDTTFCYDLCLGPYEEEDANIPLRNLYFAMHASHYSDTVYLVAQRGERSIPDRSSRFFDEASSFLSFLHGREVRVKTSFGEMTKVDMVAWYLKQGLPREDLLEVYSCFRGEKQACGACGACFRRFIALEANGVSTEGLFENDITTWPGIRTYVKNLDQYESRRRFQTEDVLRDKGIL